jgi:hypothetical protein
LEARTVIAVQPPSTSPTPQPPPPPGPPTIPGALSVTLTTQDVVLGQSHIFSASVKDAAFPSVYVWAFGDAATFTGSGPSSAHVYGAVGSYAASVTVTDADGRTVSASTTATATAVPPPPTPPAPVQGYTVTLVAAPTSVLVNTPTTLTATANPQNGAPAVTSYDWDCNGDGTPETTNTVSNISTCTYATSGSMQPKVTVTGGTVKGSGTTSVTVAAAAPLFVSIGVTGPLGGISVNAPLTFTGTVTSVGQVPQTALNWEWDFDVTTSSTFTLVETDINPHSSSFGGYGSSGVKTIKLRVTDPATGRVATGSRTVTVQ